MNKPTVTATAATTELETHDADTTVDTSPSLSLRTNPDDVPGASTDAAAAGAVLGGGMLFLRSLSSFANE